MAPSGSITGGVSVASGMPTASAGAAGSPGAIPSGAPGAMPSVGGGAVPSAGGSVPSSAGDSAASSALDAAAPSITLGASASPSLGASGGASIDGGLPSADGAIGSMQANATPDIPSNPQDQFMANGGINNGVDAAQNAPGSISGQFDPSSIGQAQADSGSMQMGEVQASVVNVGGGLDAGGVAAQAGSVENNAMYGAEDRAFDAAPASAQVAMEAESQTANTVGAVQGQAEGDAAMAHAAVDDPSGVARDEAASQARAEVDERAGAAVAPHDASITISKNGIGEDVE